MEEGGFGSFGKVVGWISMLKKFSIDLGTRDYIYFNRLFEG